MIKSISIEGLDDEQARLIREFVEFLRARRQRKQAQVRVASKRGGGEEITFATYPLGVKGEITREEIYEDV